MEEVHKMNSRKEYYNYLEKIIREHKAKNPFFKSGSNNYETDILELIKHIKNKDSFLLEKFISDNINIPELVNVSKENVLEFMKKTKKGTICRWKNKEGVEVFLINDGKNILKTDKKNMYNSILKKDIKYVYNKIEQNNLKEQKIKKKILEFFNEQKEKNGELNSSVFEKTFKELVREQGGLSSPISTATFMLSLMSGADKNEFAINLNNMGIKNVYSFERLLSKWKYEALNPEYEIIRNTYRRKKEKNIDILRSR